jgi:lipoprotein-anchoring transpeptidase ErfK/SrfK
VKGLQRASTRRIVVNLEKQSLTLYRKKFLSKDFEKVHTWEVSTGIVAQGLGTPSGQYVVHDKSRKPGYTYPDSEWVPAELRGKHYKFGDPNNPIVARWIGLSNYDGELAGAIAGVGIHGTKDEEDIGQQASHGCVRMKPTGVTELFDQVPKGTTVFIHRR